MSNGVLVLKSHNTLDNSVEALEFTIFKNRVLNDGGYIADEAATKGAIEFAKNAGITESNDIGIASPQWGLKVVGGEVVKLYSLFNADADLVVMSSNDRISLMNTQGFNTLYSVGHNAAGIGTQQFTVDSSIIMANINKPALEKGLSNYGINPVLAFGFVQEASSDTSTVSTLYEGYYNLKGDNINPSLWESKVFVRDTENAVVTGSPAVGANKYSSVVVRIDDSQMSAYASGNLMGHYPTSSGVNLNRTFIADHTRRRGVSSGQVRWLTSLVGHIAELWTVRDASEAVAQAISQRAASKYP